ncbi:MAG: hypothetical protein JST26_13280 [Bacteroidetes bacterium]|nr:hypothetical protein [Bacteroidota bacterium]
MKYTHTFVLLFIFIVFPASAQKTHSQYEWTLKNYTFKNFLLPPAEARRFDTCQVSIGTIIATIAEFDSEGNETIKKDTITTFRFQKILDTISVDTLLKLLKSPLRLSINHIKTQVSAIAYDIVCENEYPFYTEVKSDTMADNNIGIEKLKTLKGRSYLFITGISYPAGHDHISKTIHDIVGFCIIP